NDSALGRLQTISFFVMTFLFCALAVMLLWNYLRRDFAWMPRLSFGRAAAAVFLWGLLFVVVLTMISGARELMTPVAWEKQGYTYKLKNAPAPLTSAADADGASAAKEAGGRETASREAKGP